jgi:hypothetical protein
MFQSSKNDKNDKNNMNIKQKNTLKLTKKNNTTKPKSCFDCGAY